MGPDTVVVVLPGTDHDHGLLQAVEDLELEALVPKLAVKAFAKAILPRTAGFDIECPGAELGEPLAQRLGDHLRTVVAANMLWNADPSLSHSRPLGRCFLGTFSPSRRQMR